MNYLDVAVATGDAQRTSFSGSYTVTGYMRQQETNDLEPPAPARRVKRGNIRLSGRFTVPLSTICKYCIDVPKKVCESICSSGLDQTPSSCNWSPWWAWSGVSGGGEGWCCGGY